MAKVQVKNDHIDIRVSLMERLMLSERSRRVPLSSVRGVDADPPVADMVLHWADQSGVWLSGASTYQGHMIPTARNPAKTLAIDVEDDEGPIFVEVDDEPREAVASRISQALSSSGSGAFAVLGEEGSGLSRAAANSNRPPDPSLHTAMRPIDRLLSEVALDDDEELESTEAFFADPEDDDNVRRRDPLLQGSLPPPYAVGVREAGVSIVDVERIANAGLWMLAVGALCVLAGTASVSAGGVFGLVAVGAGISSCVIGGLAIRLGTTREG